MRSDVSAGRGSLEPAAREHLEDFQEFYERLEETDDLFYMFFSGNLLHWVYRALQFVPPDVNLVLIGSDLSDAEDRWIRDELDRPFHNIRSRVDDKTVWELLCATNRRHFGWLDVDCFVLDPSLFSEIRNIESPTVANTVWSYAGPAGRDILRTYFLFLNADVLRQVTEQVGVSPTVYSYEPSGRGRGAPGSTARMVGPELREILATVLPTGSDGRPVYLTETDFYDTLQMYQLVAEALGHPLQRIRDLRQQNSDEVVHVGKVSYYNLWWQDAVTTHHQTTYRIIAQADFLVLGQVYDRLPDPYVSRWRHLRDELPRLGLPTDPGRLREIMVKVLTSGGVSETGARRILGGA